jgi:hypothetical protein
MASAPAADLITTLGTVSASPTFWIVTLPVAEVEKRGVVIVPSSPTTNLSVVPKESLTTNFGAANADPAIIAETARTAAIAFIIFRILNASFAL